MPTTSTEARSLPTGSWVADGTRSTVTFSLAHLGVETLYGRFERLTARLDVVTGGGAVLLGTVDANSVAPRDGDMSAVVAAPELLDTARHGELQFRSSAVRRDRELLEVDGVLTVKATSLPIAANGTVVDADAYGAGRLWLELETVFDRRQFGLTWNAELSDGRLALGHEVRVHVALSLIRT
jgi:polyisoprenoid-binding protein YceI